MEVTVITSMNGVEQLEQNKITEFIGKIRRVITSNEKKSKELDLPLQRKKNEASNASAETQTVDEVAAAPLQPPPNAS
jgi:hypothetical protein